MKRPTLTRLTINALQQAFDVVVSTIYALLGKVKVSATDTTEDYLSQKVSAGTGIALAVLNPGANEQLSITNIGELGQQILYVGKHGDDGNTGRSMEQAFLTFTAAIAAAVALGPGPNNRIAIWCDDGGTYVENLNVPSWVGILANAALLNGTHVVADNSLLQTFRLVYDGPATCVTKDTGSGTANVNCRRMILSDGASGILCTSGDLNYAGTSITIENGFGIGNLSTGKIDANVAQMIITGTGIAIGIASSGGLDFNGNSIIGGVGSTAIYVSSTGTVHVQVAHIECSTAYVVTAAAALSLFVNELQGIRTVLGTADVTIAGFSRQQVSLVASNANTNLGTFIRFGAGIFNADGYPVGATFTLRAACQVDNGQTYEVRVYDVTAGAYLAGTITDTNASLEVKTLALALGAGERIYELHAQLTTGAGLADFVKVPSAFIDVQP
jgi:hypothetical protein